ncbi:MAG: hypothetical protein N4A46_04190, partial [Schleiferiaceae bacterium]|nr:hypothetical protein [Schleiferiaceae bacterium]
MRHKPTIEPHQLHVLKEEIHKLERAVNYYKNLSDEVAGYNIMVDSQIIFLKRDLDQKKIGYEILKSLHDIIGTQIELDEFYMSTLALLLTELKMDKVVVLWKDGQHYKSRFNLGYESEAKALLERLEISLVELNSMEHAHVLLNKASTREEHHDRLSEELQLPFLVGTPIKNNEDIEGWLIAGREKEARPFYPPLMPGDLELFEVMGGFVKAVDINFRLYDDLEKANQELEEYNKSLEKKVEERTRAIEVSKKQLELEKQKTDSLLLNILPQEVANELKDFGESKARNIDGVSILFTDFVNFTHYAENMTPEELVSELHECFTAFDKIIDKYHLEKIKTIGDAYMAVGWK